MQVLLVMPRSLRVHDSHLFKVKAALLRSGFPSQKLLAEALSISQSTVSNFLNGRPVDYLNFVEICRILGQEWRELADLSPPVTSISPVPAPLHPSALCLELPQGSVSLNSPFYIPRSPIEELCFEAIVQPGSLIRIKAPRQMGKTSLLDRVLSQAAQSGSRVISLNLQLANQQAFRSAAAFLQWFCASLGLETGQLESLTACWQLAEMIGSNQCCRVYLEQYLLADPAPPLTLGIDELDCIFEYPEIADDFLGLLRSLHEEAKRRPLWQKLRLVLVHSTEVYLPLDVNRSPFNVGLPIELSEFSLEQIVMLAEQHGLHWERSTIEQLMSLVGGHPYLVRLTLYHLARGTTNLTEIFQTYLAESSLYAEHLRRHWWNLSQEPELLAALKTIMKLEDSSWFSTESTFRLQGMGLIRFEGNECQIRCQLYEDYFRDRLLRFQSLEH